MTKHFLDMLKFEEQSMKSRIEKALLAYFDAHAKHWSKYNPELADKRDAEAWETYLQISRKARADCIKANGRNFELLDLKVLERYSACPSTGAQSMVQTLSANRNPTPSDFEAAAVACREYPAALLTIRSLAPTPEHGERVPDIPTLDDFREHAKACRDAHERRIEMYLNVSRGEADSCNGEIVRLPLERIGFTPGQPTTTFGKMLDQLQAIGI